MPSPYVPPLSLDGFPGVDNSTTTTTTTCTQSTHGHVRTPLLDVDLESHGKVTESALHPEYNPLKPAPLAPAPNTNATMTARSQFTDWMRSVAIYLVVAVHIIVNMKRVLHLSTWEEDKMDATIRVLVQFGMPLFFYLSGRASSFSKDSPHVFVWKKIQRLIIPLVFGEIFIVIPTAYIGRKYRPCANQDIDNFFEFFVDFFTHQFGCSGFEWLWFLPVLFGIAVINMPILKWWKHHYTRSHANHHGSDHITPPSYPSSTTLSGRYVPSVSDTSSESGYVELCDLTESVKSLQNVSYLVGQAVVLVALIFSLGLTGNAPPAWLVIAFVVPYVALVASIYGLRLIRRWNVFMLILLIAPFTTIGLSFINGDNYDMLNVIMTVSYHNLFYIQGYLDQLCESEYLQHLNSTTVKKTRPIFLLTCVMLFAVCNPGTSDGAGYLFRYPLYTRVFDRVSFVVGTWNTLNLFCRFGHTFWNETLDSFQYKHATQSAIVVYIVHWLFIEIMQANVIVPYDLSLLPTIVVLSTATIVGSWGSYYVILQVPILRTIFGL
eukprot:GFYU01005534.1.p1 GENE.GFYU01005534.1~~GFYU01005534.1.p1  ORF type:complete len:549 (-),score=140.37 GFYU01005534.1:1346-2992(-)